MTAVLDRIRAWPGPMIGRERLDDLDADDVDQALAELRAAGAVVIASGVITIINRDRIPA
ncbi:hypothetical protein ABT332_06585 [Saccharomonospora azurea]|uniref:hypothetical protein n=1 Tax=Saccharomonospora azurea TaxID=40988 RepID=UPI0033344320